MQTTTGTYDGLFARARAGDDDAWEELFRRCYPKVVRVVRRRLSHPMRSLYDSTDFASDVWRSLIAKADRFDFPSVQALMNFLEKAANDKIIDEHRRLTSQKRDPKRLVRLDGDGDHAAPPPVSNEPRPSQVAAAREAWQRINERLDEPGRRVVQMARDGYTTREIGEALGWHIRKVQRIIKEVQRRLPLLDVGRRELS